MREAALAVEGKTGLAAIREADAVVFVGYRFPPTDAYSRKELLGALRENENQRRHLDVHVVLGPRTNEPDPIRLEKMVRTALQNGGRVEGKVPTDSYNPTPKGTFHITVHPLWAEDFLTVLPQLHC